MSDLLRRFRTTILESSNDEIRSDPTLAGRLVLEKHGDLIVSYAPFEHVQSSARVVLVGITPGRQQASNALIEARRMILAGAEDAASLSAAKVFASFSGTIRKNLVDLLDYAGLARWLGVASSAELWLERGDLAHFTSAIRYPVFLAGENYTGAPSIIGQPLLRRYIEECLREEATALRQAIWVPLGPKPSEAVKWLVRIGALDKARVLDGLPHPSGANAERIAYFLGRKRREDLSAKTNATLIDQARERALAMVAAQR